MNKYFISACVFIALTCLTPPSFAFDGLSLGLGHSSSDKVNFYRATIKINTDVKWFDEGDWFIKPHFDLSIFYLDSRSSIINTTGDPSHLLGSSITPVFRLQRIPYGKNITPFFEAGVGGSLFSSSTLQGSESTGVDFGGTFQFENFLSAGFRFGGQQQYEIAINYFHYSNLFLYDSNDGINFTTVTMAIWF